ncbi:sensor histidine kinase [Schaalia sp. 19OD2882]|uniref:sensor histidine kinase n=1 Tax=Schaalia sp. 19OD2882 TaxID=2794089 RepID=UPI0020A79847|nr:histidine kinase [Schaalia sp. 19OD2882]
MAEQLSHLKDTHSRLLEAQDREVRASALAERTRIARDMHDGVGHRLTGLLFRTRALEVIHRGQPQVVAELGEIATGVEESLEAMRRSVHALSDEGEDLSTTLHVLARDSAVPHVHIDSGLEAQPPSPIIRCFNAIAREALTNAAKHARADNAWIRLDDYPAFWRMIVTNDGLPAPGTPTAWEVREGAGLGMRSMRDRVEALGGSLRITPSPRFTIHVTIPKENA